MPAHREGASSGKIGVGDTLRTERERRGLDHTQVSEMTRIRPYILEALEREQWDRLPPRVIVSGFIRSYSRSLDRILPGDSEVVLDACEGTVKNEFSVVIDVGDFRRVDDIVRDLIVGQPDARCRHHAIAYAGAPSRGEPPAHTNVDLAKE